MAEPRYFYKGAYGLPVARDLFLAGVDRSMREKELAAQDAIMQRQLESQAAIAEANRANAIKLQELENKRWMEVEQMRDLADEKKANEAYKRQQDDRRALSRGFYKAYKDAEGELQDAQSALSAAEQKYATEAHEYAVQQAKAKLTPAQQRQVEAGQLSITATDAYLSALSAYQQQKPPPLNITVLKDAVDKANAKVLRHVSGMPNDAYQYLTEAEAEYVKDRETKRQAIFGPPAPPVGWLPDPNGVNGDGKKPPPKDPPPAVTNPLSAKAPGMVSPFYGERYRTGNPVTLDQEIAATRGVLTGTAATAAGVATGGLGVIPSLLAAGGVGYAADRGMNVLSTPEANAAVAANPGLYAAGALIPSLPSASGALGRFGNYTGGVMRNRPGWIPEATTAQSVRPGWIPEPVRATRIPMQQPQLPYQQQAQLPPIPGTVSGTGSGAWVRTQSPAGYYQGGPAGFVRTSPSQPATYVPPNVLPNIPGQRLLMYQDPRLTIPFYRPNTEVLSWMYGAPAL